MSTKLLLVTLLKTSWGKTQRGGKIQNEIHCSYRPIVQKFTNGNNIIMQFFLRGILFMSKAQKAASQGKILQTNDSTVLFQDRLVYDSIQQGLDKIDSRSDV